VARTSIHPYRRYLWRVPEGTSGETVDGVSTGSLEDVMRLIGVLALAAPVAIGALTLFLPDALISWIDGGLRSVLAAITAGAIGVSLTALVVGAHFRYRFSRLVKAAEEIAAGDYTIQVPVQGVGLEGRLAGAVNDISGALADTHDRATFDRLTGVSNRQALLCRSRSWTSITSRPSTTPMATASGTWCCAV
jgi:HAMP domain-containing protein